MKKFFLMQMHFFLLGVLEGIAVELAENLSDLIGEIQTQIFELELKRAQYEVNSKEYRKLYRSIRDLSDEMSTNFLILEELREARKLRKFPSRFKAELRLAAIVGLQSAERFWGGRGQKIWTSR